MEGTLHLSGMWCPFFRMMLKYAEQHERANRRLTMEQKLGPTLRGVNRKLTAKIPAAGTHALPRVPSLKHYGSLGQRSFTHWAGKAPAGLSVCSQGRCIWGSRSEWHSWKAVTGHLPHLCVHTTPPQPASRNASFRGAAPQTSRTGLRSL